MSEFSMGPMSRLYRIFRVFLLSRQERRYLRTAAASELFDADFYRKSYAGIHPLFHRVPLRHFIVFGERRGFRPNADFSPAAYRRYNPDVEKSGFPPFLHFVKFGRFEERVIRDFSSNNAIPDIPSPRLHFDPARPKARFAIVLHVFYPDLWPEFAETLSRVPFRFDLYVTLTCLGEETSDLADEIRTTFPGCVVAVMPNRGRDILPFVALANAGALDGYEAVCKIHTKKSPHRDDGEKWRHSLLRGILPATGLETLLQTFLEDEDSAFWVADGQHYTDTYWWGSNFETTRDLMRRLEIEIERDALSFPAGSIFWMKPLMVKLLKAMELRPGFFEAEESQLDGTVAHAVERAMGFLAASAGQTVVQTSDLTDMAEQGRVRPDDARTLRPAFVSALYLPQFHPIPENDAVTGKGVTGWHAVASAQPLFQGQAQPFLPSDLGFYDLRVTEVMGQQAALARDAGIDAFCVCHYWFDGRRVFEQPLDRLLERPEIDFPFFLCWANESGAQTPDDPSVHLALAQSYSEGFEDRLVQSSLPYMRDPRYIRPDGIRPRFVIQRPEDMPDPEASVTRMRQAWRHTGLGEVELGAVLGPRTDETPLADTLFDFWIEMPPHGLDGIGEERPKRDMADGFCGRFYDYAQVIEASQSQSYIERLPRNTICGAMPAWDTTARHGLHAHVAYGGNPVRFGYWLQQIAKHRLPGSYRQELFLNAWNAWTAKAVLEPGMKYGHLNLEVLRKHVRGPAAG